MNRPVDLPSQALVSDDAFAHPTAHASLSEVIESRLSRRTLLRGVLGSGTSVALGSFTMSACGGDDGDGAGDAPAASQQARRDADAGPLLRFGAVGKSLEDRVQVPAGYAATVLYATGDALRRETPAFRNDGSDTEWEHRAGITTTAWSSSGSTAAASGATPEAPSAACSP
jgi:secreted PhoX family phosphatase